MKQYRKGLTAVIDRCAYISYNRYHFVMKSFNCCGFNCCCSGRDLCMLTSRYMLPGCARHLAPLYVPVSPCARSATCKPCPMALVSDGTVHCSRAPGLQLASSIYRRATTLRAHVCVGFIYIQLLKLFKNGPGMPKKRPRSLRSLGFAS